jgi:hypothetical protein
LPGAFTERQIFKGGTNGKACEESGEKETCEESCKEGEVEKLWMKTSGVLTGSGDF